MSDEPDFRGDDPEDPSEDQEYLPELPPPHRHARPDLELFNKALPTLRMVYGVLQALSIAAARELIEDEAMDQVMGHAADQLRAVIAMLERFENYSEAS
jgi:hypothetical protein